MISTVAVRTGNVLTKSVLKNVLNQGTRSFAVHGGVAESMLEEERSRRVEESHYHPLAKNVSVEMLLKNQPIDGAPQISPNSTVYQAIESMDKAGLGAAIVTDNKHNVMGIITERDYMSKVIVKDKRSHTTKCQEVMTKLPFVVTPEDTFDTCLNLIFKQGIRHLPVVANNPGGASALGPSHPNGVIGLLTIQDLMEKLYLMHLKHPSKDNGHTRLEKLKGLMAKDVARSRGSHGKPYFSVGKEQPVFEGVKTMAEHNVGALVVTASANQHGITGIFTERDYLGKLVLVGRRSHETPMSEVMTANPVTVEPRTRMSEVLKLIVEQKFRHVPIAESIGMEQKKCIGMLSIKDVMDCLY